MSDKPVAITHLVTAGGLAGKHQLPPDQQILVGPSTSSERNTLIPGLIPIACWRLEDVRFEFDSSFIRPEVALELNNLSILLGDHPRAPASVFGHADPVGFDDYNKQLSGRRATVIYALLTRRVDLWEDIYSHPLGGDRWGLKSVQIMLDALGFAPATLDGKRSASFVDAVRRFQRANSLKDDGDPGPKTRARLFPAYMDSVCRNKNDEAFRLEATDFLAHGADLGGRGDYQGCGEFNPSLIFSQAENQEFQKPSKKGERDAENAPNRRVVVFFFRPGSVVDSKGWPCPRVKEGVAGCKKRFWSDAEKRRSFQAKRREYKDTQDTFACRFYDRIGGPSPCESFVLRDVRIRLFDRFVAALPEAPFVATFNGVELTGKADGEGFIEVTQVLAPATLNLKWRERLPADDPASGVDVRDFFEYELDVFIAAFEHAAAEAVRQRLHNLGFRHAPTLEENITAFQRHYGRPQTGRVADVEVELTAIHDGTQPKPPGFPEPSEGYLISPGET